MTTDPQQRFRQAADEIYADKPKGGCPHCGSFVALDVPIHSMAGDFRCGKCGCVYHRDDAFLNETAKPSPAHVDDDPTTGFDLEP